MYACTVEVKVSLNAQPEAMSLWQVHYLHLLSPHQRRGMGKIKGEFSEMEALPFCVMEGILCLSIKKYYVAMNGFKERILEIGMKCTSCHRTMASGQKAYTRIEEGGITVRMGSPICHNCAVHNFCSRKAGERRSW